MGNVIPRKFNLIIGKMLIDTNANDKNDIMHLYKDEEGRSLLLNTRTKKSFQANLDIIRDKEMFEMLEIQK